MATRAEWSERVRRWERSGLEIAEFARREGIKAKLLGWWRWKLGTIESPAPPAPAPRFLPVRVVASAPPGTPAPIEIALPNGRASGVIPPVACISPSRMSVPVGFFPGARTGVGASLGGKESAAVT